MFFLLNYLGKLTYLLHSYYEDLFAKDAGQPTVVNVASKIYRAVSISLISHPLESQRHF